MKDEAKELTKQYQTNVLLKLKADALRREHVLENQKLLKKLREAFKTLVNNGEGGSQECERVLRNIRNLEEAIVTAESKLPSLEDQHKTLIAILKEKYPEELSRRKAELEKELREGGVL